jgi:hypothetical protein
VRSLSSEYLISPFYPAERCSLTQVDLLSFMAPGESIQHDSKYQISAGFTICMISENVLLQLCFCLLFWSTSDSRNPGFCCAVQDMLSINGALSKCGPAFTVVVILVLWFCGCSCNVILKGSEIRKKACYTLSALIVYYLTVSSVVPIRLDSLRALQRPLTSRNTCISKS